ncbi:hypothetical protein BP6252_03401 [Coleophoma cylindrospora]|uniref:NAD(P)-binding protein n=1 Tax=Coleophoma cylindrospora TaxID=1849047 RepID=A0A3D8S7L2_9HELO|nr:hypothetical protein BP6252_03401 [Coleophoma cylindrospora]
MSLTTQTQGVTRRHDIYPFISPTLFAGTLKGKVVLITGASRGIGRATALAFANAGAHVAALARTSSDIDTLVAEIKAKHSLPALAITGSVLDNPQKIVADVEAALGPIDILVNNAGITRMSPLGDEIDLDLWWNVFEVNIKAPVAMIHAVLPGFKARGGGTIITVGSGAVEVKVPYMSSYTGSKAGIFRAIEIIDLELRPSGIYNFFIHPGAVKTGLTNKEGNDKINGSEMKKLVDIYDVYLTETPELAANSMVALAVNEDLRVFSGRYLDATEDLEELLALRETVEERDLYKLRISRP